MNWRPALGCSGSRSLTGDGSAIEVIPKMMVGAGALDVGTLGLEAAAPVTTTRVPASPDKHAGVPG